jgi:hypothetical protein
MILSVMLGPLYFGGSMIKFDKADKQVKVTISPGIDNQAMALHFNTNDEWYARLLATHLHEALWNRLKTIREEAYCKGWKDKATHKKPKDTWFSGAW